MSVAPDPFTSRRDTLAFVLCLLLSVVVRVAPPAVQDSVASAVRESVLLPLLAMEEWAEEIKASRSRYEAVVAQRDSVFLEAMSAQAFAEENERLREVLELAQRLPVRHVAAEVLHQAGAGEGLTFVLSAGRDQGVQAMAPVIAPGGLVGVVRTVDAKTCVAIGWAHPEFRVSAMTPEGGVFGIVQPMGQEGPNRMLLELTGVPYRDLVAPGTPVVTSGLGGVDGVYPRGVPIGEVIGVADEREGWSRTYFVRPAVHPAAVQHVLILTGRALRLDSAFAEPR